MKKLFTVFVTLIIITAIPCVKAQAPSSAFDELPLNGMALYEQLRKQYYIGALYLEKISQDPESIINMSGRKRMELRITIDKWSPRRFAQQWNQSIVINNDRKTLEEFSEQILKFTQIPRQNLEANDHIVIDMDPETGTTVYLNSQKMLQTPNSAFFDVLVNTWIGQRPPSSDFKNHILTLPTGQTGTDLLTSYDAIQTPKSREAVIAKWLEDEKKEGPKKEVAQTSNIRKPSLLAAPPESGTRVTAKRTRKSIPVKAPSVAAAPVTTAVAAPKPTIALAKPTLDTTRPTTAQPAVIKKAIPTTPTPKPQAVVAKAAIPIPEEKKTSAQKQAQDALIRNYRSNILKLTYLNTQYPKRAMALRQEGLVVIKVTLNRQGKLMSMEPITSSKHKLLNKAARHAVKQSASSYPEPPEDLEGSEIELSLPFNFKL